MRNTVVINGLETHRLYLKKPVDVLVREFLSKFHDRFVSKSVVKYIIKQHLPHLTIPKHSDHDSASCGIHHCLANTISCSNNENCKKYANLSAENNSKIAKQRFWTVHKLVKIVQTHNSDTMQSYNFHVFNI